jgi:hypothetical protein
LPCRARRQAALDHHQAFGPGPDRDRHESRIRARIGETERDRESVDRHLDIAAIDPRLVDRIKEEAARLVGPSPSLARLAFLRGDQILEPVPRSAKRWHMTETHPDGSRIGELFHQRATEAKFKILVVHKTWQHFAGRCFIQEVISAVTS